MEEQKIEQSGHAEQNPAHINEMYKKFQGNQKKPSNPKWVNKCFNSVTHCHQKIQNILSKITGLKGDILSLMDKINHPSYPAIIKQKIRLLVHYIELFTDRKISTQISLPLNINSLANRSNDAEVNSTTSQLSRVGFFGRNTQEPRVTPLLPPATHSSLLDEAGTLFETENYVNAYDLYAALFFEHQSQDIVVHARFQFCVVMNTTSDDHETYNSSITALDQLIKDNPLHLEPYFIKAKLYLAKSFLYDAKKTIDLLLEIQANHIPAQKLRLKILDKIAGEQHSQVGPQIRRQ